MEEGDVFDVNIDVIPSNNVDDEKHKANVVVKREEGMVQLHQYVRLVVADEGFREEQTGSTSMEALQMIWGRLRSPIDKDCEVRMGLKIISLCRRDMKRVTKQLERLQSTLNSDSSSSSNSMGEVDRRRAEMLLRYLHGELLALRAIAEWHMRLVDDSTTTSSDDDGEEEEVL